MADLTFAEYFAGIGLVRLGLEPLGWRVLFANDIASQKFQMYSAHFGNGNHTEYLIADIYTIDPDAVPETTLAAASFPCIDLSVAGNRAGLSGQHSGTFWGFIDILQGMGVRRPPLVMLENVLGWLTANNGQDYPAAIVALNKLGYTCDAFVLNAWHFVPQSRPRLFLIGALGAAAHPDPTDALRRRPAALWTDRLIQAVARRPDLQWMVLPLPDPGPKKHTLTQLLEKLPDDDEAWWPQHKVDHLVSQMSPQHLGLIKKNVNWRGFFLGPVFRRVRADGPRAEVRFDDIAGCLRTPVGGSSKQIVIAALDGQVKARWMTAREYARLQGVPDEYPIDVPYIQALWGFGDAVCVPAISWIAEHALNPLAHNLGPHAAQ